MHFNKIASAYLTGSLWLSSSTSTSAQGHLIDAAVSKHEFLWDEIPAHPELIYYDCFGDFKCARLQVPLDWNASEHEDNRTMEIAVIRLPATVPVTDPRYGGAIITNPGGPGGSGVRFALGVGHELRTIVSAGPSTAADSSAKHFDIISFDPRGVNNTRPFLSCFPDTVALTTYDIETAASGVFGSSDMAYKLNWARARAMAEGCSRRAIELGIVLGGQVAIADSHAEVMDRVKYRHGQEMVQYWGFSYGTVIGVTMSAMYPERMSRIILDGVTDSFDYMEGGWLSNLHDTDMLIAKFGEYCWLGGPKNCALFHEDGPAAILEQFMAIVQSLKEEPIGVPAVNGNTAQVATYSDLKALFKKKCYNPLFDFHTIARIMSELRAGNGTGLVQAKTENQKLLNSGLSEQCTKDGPYSLACFNGTKDGFGSVGTAILCLDAEPQINVTREEYWLYAQELMASSKLIGDSWASIRVPCTQWHIRPKWRYEGNFTATTAHPILFVGNTFDPVTPIRNAFKMAKGFEESVVLHQDSEGHCSIAAASLCTARAQREYFQTGMLPKNGTVCDVPRHPLDGFSEEETPKLPEGEEDEELWKALVYLSKH
ncbi:hypothetical protein MBLNU459_g7244t2 [Dothideomycetes sp. NU459]